MADPDAPGPAEQRSPAARVASSTRNFARRALGVTEGVPVAMDGRVSHMEVVLDDADHRLGALEVLCREVAAAVDHQGSRLAALQEENERLQSLAGELARRIAALEAASADDG